MNVVLWIARSAAPAVAVAVLAVGVLWLFSPRSSPGPVRQRASAQEGRPRPARRSPLFAEPTEVVGLDELTWRPPDQPDRG